MKRILSILAVLGAMTLFTSTAEAGHRHGGCGFYGGRGFYGPSIRYRTFSPYYGRYGGVHPHYVHPRRGGFYFGIGF